MTCVYCSVNLFYNAQAVQSLYPAVVDDPVGEVDEDPCTWWRLLCIVSTHVHYMYYMVVSEFWRAVK